MPWKNPNEGVGKGGVWDTISYYVPDPIEDALWMAGAYNPLTAPLVGGPVNDAMQEIAGNAVQEVQRIPRAFQEEGPVSGALTAFDVGTKWVPEAGKYAAGMGIGALQAGAETLGINPSDRGLNVRNRLADTFEDVGQAGYDFARDMVPFGDKFIPDRDVDGDAIQKALYLLDSPENDRTLQPVGDDFAGIIDPSQARERYRDVAPPVVEGLTDLAGGFGAAGYASKAALTGRAGLAQKLGMESLKPVVHPLGQAIPSALQQAAESTMGRVAGKLTPLVGGAAGAAEGIREAGVDPQTGQPITGTDYYVRAGLMGIGGLALGAGLAATARNGLRILRQNPHPYIEKVAASDSPAVRLGAKMYNEGVELEHRGRAEYLRYPGGWWGWASDRAFSELTDSLAGLSRTEKISAKRIESGVAQAEAAAAEPTAKAQVTALKDKLANANVEYDTGTTNISNLEKMRKAADDDIKLAKKGDPAVIAERERALSTAKAEVSRIEADIKRRSKLFLLPRDEGWTREMAVSNAEKIAELKEALKAAQEARKSASTALTQAKKDFDPQRVRAAEEARASIDEQLAAARKQHEIQDRVRRDLDLELRESTRQLSVIQTAQVLNKKAPDNFPSRVARTLSGMSGKVQAEWKRFEADVLLPRMAPARAGHDANGKVVYDPMNMVAVGVKKTGDEQALFNQYMYRRSVQQKLEKGLAVYAGKFDDLDDDMKLFADADGFIRDGGKWKPVVDEWAASRLTPEQTARFEETFVRMTDWRNDLVREAYRWGLIDKENLDRMLDGNYVYFGFRDVQSKLDDISERYPLPGRKLFAYDDVVEHERTAREPFTANVDNFWNSSKKIIQEIEQNKVGFAMRDFAVKDPMFFGEMFKKYIPPELSRLNLAMRDRDILTPQISALTAELQQLEDAVKATRRPATSAATQLKSLDDRIQLSIVTQSDPRHMQHLQDLKTQWTTEAATRKQAFDAADAALNARKPDLERTIKELESKYKHAELEMERAQKAIDRAQQSTKRPVPQGEALWPVVEDGAVNFYRTPDWLRDIGAGLDEPQVKLANETWKRWMQILGAGMWRSAVTTYSLRFALRNPFRDLKAVIQNYPHMTPDFTKSYLAAWGEVFGMKGMEKYADMMDALARQTDDMDTYTKVAELRHKIATSDISEMYRTGGGIGSYTEQLAKVGTQIAGDQKIPIIEKPMDLIRSISQMLEMPARVAIFKAERKAGATAEQAAYAARTYAVDFSKGGSMVRTLNLWFPLLNARVQGEVQSWESFREDPTRFMGRLHYTSVIPYVLTYAANREKFGDLLDKIPLDILDRNIPIILQRIQHPETGDDVPLYLSIPMNEVEAAFMIPIRHMLDDKYHQESETGQKLDPSQRTLRPTSNMIKQIIANFIPTDPGPDDLDPYGLIRSAVFMMPVVSTEAQLWANRDDFRGEAIINPDAYLVAPEFRRNQDTSLMAQWLTEKAPWMGAMSGIGVAPAATEFRLRGYLGPAYTGIISPLANQVLEAMGYQPKIALTAADLGVPDDAAADEKFAAWLNWQKREDPRHWLVKANDAIFVKQGVPPSIRSRTEISDPVKRKRWDETIEFESRNTAWVHNVHEPAKQKLFTSKESRDGMSHVQIKSRAIALAQERKAHRKGLATGLPGAITDMKARDEFIKSLPGVPVGAEYSAALAQLPPDLDLQALAARYDAPPGVDLTKLNSLQQKEKRDVELRQMANELSRAYGVPISPSTLKAGIVAFREGVKLPTLGVPEVFADLWVDEYIAPDGITELSTAREKQALRLAALSKIVEENGIVEKMQEQGLIEDGNVSPEAQARTYVLRRYIEPRLRSLGPVYELEVSQNNADALSAYLDDPEAMPRYIDAEGKRIDTGPKQADAWDNELTKLEASGLSRDKWPPQYRLLDLYRSYGKVQKIMTLYSDDRYSDYARWYGIGRNLTPSQWDQYMSGEIPRYILDGKALDSNTSTQLDFIVALYDALPANSQERRVLAQAVRGIRKMAVPSWSKLMEIDELKPDGMRAIERKLLEDEQALYTREGSDNPELTRVLSEAFPISG